MRKKVILFLISQSITLFGSTLVQMAVVWYATLLTSSGLWVAAFSLCSYLPQFLVSFWGGVWADRFPGKWLIVGSDAAIAAVTLAMAAAIPHIQDQTVLLFLLLLMSAVRSLGAGIQTPAVHVVLPRLVPEEQLMRANGINAALQSLVQFAAPAAAGAVLVSFSLRSTLLIDVLTAALGIGLLCLVPLPFQRFPEKKTSAFQELKSGISYAVSHRDVGILLLIYGGFVFFCVPAGYLSGLFVSRVYGESYGYLTAVELAGFAGMTAGGLLAAYREQKKTRTLRNNLTVFGTMAILMAVSSRFVPYLILMAAYGVALTGVQTALTTLLQEKTEAFMQGRIFGLFSSMYSGFLPLGMAVFGPLADHIPLRILMILSGAALIGLGKCSCAIKYLAKT
ncbi:MAG TPA: MFS transporter [Candidatus Choladocola avistercoris]|nr:MFS transporter [Candidatus Choladocola avistercoris]